MAANETVSIETTSTRLVYENRWMRVREDTIRRRDGSTGIYGVVEKADFVVIVPVEDDGRVRLVEQYRYPVKGRSLIVDIPVLGPTGTVVGSRRRSRTGSSKVVRLDISLGDQPLGQEQPRRFSSFWERRTPTVRGMLNFVAPGGGR